MERRLELKFTGCMLTTDPNLKKFVTIPTLLIHNVPPPKLNVTVALGATHVKV
jgi:hypothetical protein